MSEENEILRKSCNRLSQAGHENYTRLYDNEFTWLISQMEKHMPRKDIVEVSENLLELSELADEALCETNQTYDTELGSYYSERPSMINITDLMNLKWRHERNRLLLMHQEQTINNRDDEFLLMGGLRRKPEGFNYIKNATENKPKPKKGT